MKKIFILLIISLFASYANANNLQIGAVTKIDATHLQFTIQWDNSWRVAAGPANWDAVWLFVKYQDCATTLWRHVNLSTVVANHSVSGVQLEVLTVADAKGIFLRQNANGNGNISSAMVTLNFNTLVDAGYNYQVFGIEMVNIPTGNFVIGDCTGGTGGWGFYCQNITAATQAAGLAVGSYCNTGSSGALLSTFPLGYNSFYCMKYEISQEQYAAFLNTLTYDQQTNVTAATAPPNSAVGTLAIAPNTNGRNGIRIQTPGTLTNIPAVYGNDLNNNGTFNEAADGQNIACNYLQWSDLMAYLDWSALRPMTEFEFEKVCRGTLSQVTNEYAWGSPAAGPGPITQATSGALTNAGTANELSAASGNGLCAWGANNAALGPLRCGFAATPTTSRVQAGASYYGCMDMSGNVSEQCLGGTNINYGGFTTVCGDGLLLVTGYANTANWPAWGGVYGGGILRGGDWFTNDARTLQTSDRWNIGNLTNVNQGRDLRVGGRGVR